MIRRLRECSNVYFLAGGAVEVHDFKADPSGFDDCIGECGDGHVVDFTNGSFDVERAVCLDVHGKKVPELVGVRLHPGTGQELAWSDMGSELNTIFAHTLK